MSFGTNLQFLRKRQGMTQEDFAEKMLVTRQTVSKWESDSSFPEMEKLLQLCDVFSCDMDTLTRGNVEQALVEDTQGYDREMNRFTAALCSGVALTLLGVAALLLLLSQGVQEPLGGMVMMAFLLVAVAIFIIGALRHGTYVKKHPYITPFYSQQQRDRMDRHFPLLIALPTVLILLGIIGLMGAEAYPRPTGITEDAFAYLLSGFFLLLLAAAVPLYVFAGLQQYKYNVEEYNRTNSPSPEARRRATRAGTACGAIMLLTTIIYLVLGLGWGLWNYAWIYGIAGIVCAIVSMVVEAMDKGKEGP